MSTTSATQIATPSIEKIVTYQRAFFSTLETQDYKFRKTQLIQLRQNIIKYENDLLEALKKDLHKPAFEAYAYEIGIVLHELDNAIQNLSRWVQPQPVSTPLFHFKATSAIHHDPYGTVLIIAPWNYPFQLLFVPLIGAIAAGNTVVLKPSELSAATSAICTKICQETFEPSYVACLEGGVEVSKALLEIRWDYIFFTGSTEVGRIVYQSAAKHLTPVTLELGGKSPCIIDRDTDITLTARRIAWGKFANAGQTCIAPDYLFVDERVYDKLVTALIKEIEQFYGPDAHNSPDYCRIISEKHHQRLVGYLKDGEVLYGGKFDATDKYLSPTLMTNIAPNSNLMKDEIFGPILPIMTYNDVANVTDFINERPKPLAMYIFSNNSRFQKRLLAATSAGGVSINDTIMHFSNPELPFGGVGESGIGAYHGKHTFDLFSHRKSVLHKSFLVDLPMRYAPYKLGISALKQLMKWTF